MRMYKKGEVIFKEGDEIDEMLFVVEGEVELTSTLGYSIKVGPGEVIGEWCVADLGAQESATATTKVELEEFPEDELEHSLRLLLERSFKRIALVNSNMSAETKDPHEVSKVFSRVKRGSWNTLRSILKNPYYRALRRMRKGDKEGAFEIFMQMDKRSSPVELVEDSEVWKTICLFDFNPDVALRRYNAIIRRRSEFSKYVSFGVLEKLVSQGEENLPTMFRLYYKFGMVIPSRTVMFFEGEYGDDAYFILKGSPRVARYSSGEEVMIAFLGPGEMVGEISPIGNVPRTATVYTIHPLQVLAFDSGTLLESLKDYPDFATEILRVILRRIERTKRLMEAGASASKKLQLLLELKGFEKLNEAGITISELASYLGASRQDVFDMIMSRRIGRVRSDGTIKFEEV